MFSDEEVQFQYEEAVREVDLTLDELAYQLKNLREMPWCTLTQHAVIDAERDYERAKQRLKHAERIVALNKRFTQQLRRY